MDSPSSGDGARALSRGGLAALMLASGQSGSSKMEQEIRGLIDARRKIVTAEEDAQRQPLDGTDASRRAAGGAGTDQPQPRLSARAIEGAKRADFEGAPRTGQDARREEPPNVKALIHAARREVVVARVTAELAAEVTERDDRRGVAEGAQATGATSQRPPTETGRGPTAGPGSGAAGRAATLLSNAVAAVPSNTGPHIDLLF